MPEWTELTPEQQMKVAQALKANAQRANVTLADDEGVTIKAEGATLEVPPLPN